MMKVVSGIFVLLLTCIYSFLFAQAPATIAEGIVRDKKTHQPLEAANVRFKGSLAAVLTDSTGYYKLSTILRPRAVVASYLGYEAAEMPIIPGKKNEIDIELKGQNVNLKEIVIKPPKRKKKREIDTTALYIYHHVVDNKEFNRATAIDSYYYKEYTKMAWSVLNPTKRFLQARFFKPYRFFFEKPDTNQEGRVFIPLFLEEDYLETYYRKKPQHLVNVIHYKHISGLRGSLYVKLIGYHFQVSDAYENVHVVFQKSFLSPFSPEAYGVYNFHVLDTAKINGRTSYKINFISYRPNEKANLDYVFDLLEEQNFEQVDSVHWMMTSENQVLQANLTKQPAKLAFQVVKTTKRKDISTHTAIPEKVLLAKDDIVDPDAYKKKLSYIDSVRFDTLTASEKLVYHHFDTVRHIPAYIGLSEFATFLTTANLKAGPVDFGRLYRIVSRNNVEGWRFRMGVYTNPSLSDKLFLGAYGAYGTTDRRWKYSFNARTLLPSKYDRWHAIEAEFKSDMVILGQENPLLTYDNITTLITNLTLDKVMRTQEFNLYYERDWIKGLSSNITFTDRRFFTVPGIFNFTVPDGSEQITLPGFNVTELTADLRYCKTDYYYEYYTYRQALQTKTPSITLTYTLGLKNDLFGGDYTYHKIQAKFQYRWQLPVGYSKIMVRAGYILGNAPYPVSFISSSNLGILRDDLSFQSTAPFEFATDKFVMVWWEHYFEGFFLNRIPYVNKLHMREFVQVKALYGDYSAANAELMTVPAGITSPGPTLPYVEVGCGVENILNLFQVGFFWRVTYRNTPDVPNFSVKIGIYPGF
jgi:hypothetical protein